MIMFCEAILIKEHYFFLSFYTVGIGTIILSNQYNAILRNILKMY